jgi:hypothetical protein
MHVAKELYAEALLMMPAAILEPIEIKQEQKDNLIFNVEWRPETLLIKPVGLLKAEPMLENMPGLVKSYSLSPFLDLDMCRAKGMNHLILSALIVIMRNFCRQFEQIGITNLPYWAADRLACTGGGNLMGKGWRCQAENRMVELKAPVQSQEKGVGYVGKRLDEPSPRKGAAQVSLG